MFESEDEEAAARANKMTKMMRAKYNFRQKQIEQQKFNEKIAAQQKAAEEAAQRAEVQRMQAENKASGTGGYQAGYDSGFMEGPSGAGYGMGASDKGGSDTMGSFAKGGIVDMLEIYD